MDELKHNEETPESVLDPEAAEASEVTEAGEAAQAPAAAEEGCGGCSGCAGGCPAAAAQAELTQAVEDAMAQELLPQTPAEEAPPAAPEETVSVVDVHFRSGGKVYYFDPDGLELKEADHVIIETARGPEFGICAGGSHQVPAADIIPPLRKVLRIATEQDEQVVAANREKEQKAFAVCLEKIREHKLDMQLVSAECAFDGSKVLFFFTAESRVDFRELVKNLASVFRTRIELRQIGVRDKAKMVGGLGVCGRPFCCSQFLDDFQPVSIKMAKTQNLSLNPTKISGTCGRLMCCLKYEQEAYEDLLKAVPKSDSFVDTPDGRGTVCDVNLLRQTVRVRMEDHPDTFGTYACDEIAVLRNGKAKKTDPPIPKDLAPISGKPHAARHVTPKQEEDALPALFKQLDEYADPNRVHPVPESAPREPGEVHRRRSRRRRPSGGAKPAEAGTPKSENRPAAAPAAPGQGQSSGSSRSGSRRRRSRRPRGHEGGQQAQQQ